MKKTLLFVISCLSLTMLAAQTVPEKLQKAFFQFESDSQLRHAVISLYVVDAETGKVVFEKNSLTGLAPASTQKIITSVTAFELLGKDFHYETAFAYSGSISKGVLNGQLVLIGSGDPTLGSWRFSSTNPQGFYNRLATALKTHGIEHIAGKNGFVIDASRFSDETSQDGWIWQDIGNYYGANAFGLNWRENQFDVRFRPGNVGNETSVDSMIPGYVERSIQVKNEVLTGKEGSGDNTYFYFQNRNKQPSGYVARGTIPAAVKYFDVSASHFDPVSFLGAFLSSSESKSGKKIFINAVSKYSKSKGEGGKHINRITIHKELSPGLDSIIYWFNKKSINLYGEALLKTIAFEKTGKGITDSGLVVLKKFWKENGLDENELNMRDGSGLSPLNRVTTHAQVEILKFARKRAWYSYFYNALPEFNNMKMKSGTISDTKGFCGYHKSGEGREYIFSFLVNNYNGRSSNLVNKMYKVLDQLK